MANRVRGFLPIQFTSADLGDCLWSIWLGINLDGNTQVRFHHFMLTVSMDDLLHLLHSDGADELRLHVGQAPIIVLEGEQQPLEGPLLSTEDTEHLWQNIANTRQRRELRAHGVVDFIYRFRSRADFVVHARMEDENVGMDIH